MAKDQKPTIALTGATGFLGGHILKVFQDEKYNIQSLTRMPRQSTQQVNWIEGSLEQAESLQQLCAGADTLINIAGLTKAVNRSSFFDVNLHATEKVFEAAAKTGVKHVIHVSSLAAREPKLSHYGASKAATESLLANRDWPFEWSIIRPPAIYGPGDKEILKLLKASKYGILPAPGSVDNHFSMIHAADLAKAILCRAEGGATNTIEEIDDGAVDAYTIKDVINALNSAKPVKAISAPFWLMATLGAGGDAIAKVTGKPSMLTVSTARYLCHPDWTVHNAKRFSCKSWSPQFDLKAGLNDTMNWYRKNQLL